MSPAYDVAESHIFYSSANLGNEKIYIQSVLDLSSEKKKIQEENSLIRINGSFKKIIIQKKSFLIMITMESTSSAWKIF